jgi:GrpB-like predicted nucleotidyltransferase (UPF0157 family)
VDIEHIGSTSVPHLAAKPIIDIDIVYGKEIPFEEIKSSLEKLGYYHNGNQDIEDREIFKRFPSTKKHTVLDLIRHHLYVCPAHSQELKRHLLLRDYLRNNNIEREEYEKIKYRIAEMANQNKKEYARLKEVSAREFIDAIIKKANEITT